MKKILKVIKLIITISACVGVVAGIKEQLDKGKIKLEQRIHTPYGPYEKYIKRPLDAFLATGALIVFSPILLITAFLVRIKLGSPVIFTQQRPGMIDPITGKEKIFKLYKFRSMTDERDENEELLPDEVRLTEFGKRLRATSLDELPELINIIKGDMAVVGPRPQLVKDMIFMSDKQRRRHEVRQGLTGLAQVNGRNAIDWEEKFDWDLKYLKKINFLNDFRILCRTIEKVLYRGESLNELAVTWDYGDWLLENNKISIEKYNNLKFDKQI